MFFDIFTAYFMMVFITNLSMIVTTFSHLVKVKSRRNTKSNFETEPAAAASVAGFLAVFEAVFNVAWMMLLTADRRTLLRQHRNNNM